MLTGYTDNLCLLIYNVNTSQKQRNVYIKHMTRNANNERVCYRVRDVIDHPDRVIVNFILFSHSFTGCNSTSGIHNFRKQAIFSKLAASNNLRRITEQLFLDNISPERIGNASIYLFEELYSPRSSLQQIRMIKYHEMVSPHCAGIDPALLLPSPRATYYHGLRIYHQMNVWRKLSDNHIDPLSWGCKISN